MDINLGPHQDEKMLTAGWQAFALKVGLSLEGDITQPGEYEQLQHHFDVIEACSEEYRLN